MVVLATTWLLLPDKLTRLREGGDKILWSRLLLPMSPSIDEASLEEFVMAPFPVGTVNTAEKKRAGFIQEGCLIQFVWYTSMLVCQIGLVYKLISFVS